MELESHNIVLDSRYAYATIGGNWIKQYYFDWSVIPDGKYELSFSFISVPQNNIGDTYSLFSNMISPQNVYQASSAIGARTIAYLGSLKYDAFNATTSNINYVYADQQTNPPVICNRPMTNIFTISIFDGLAVDYNITIPDYILTLHFKPLRLGLA